MGSLQGGRADVLSPEGEVYGVLCKIRKKILSQGEIDKVRNELENLIINLENEFTETDLKVIKNNIAHLQDTKEEEQKTLKEHQDDIVKCAEMFF